MTNLADWEDAHFDAAPWGGYEDESDLEYAQQFGPFDEMPGDDDYSLADDQWGMTADAFIGGE